MFVDINAYLGNWPFRVVPEITAEGYEARCKEEGIERALVSSIDGIFREDPTEANEKLLESVEGSDVLRAVPVVNPSIAGWSSSLDTYISAGVTDAAKIHPNFHGYGMDLPALDEVADRLTAASKPMLVPLRMEDERFQNPRMQVAPVPVESVVSFAVRHPGLTVICLNAYRKEVIVAIDLQAVRNLCFDIAFVDWFKPVDDLLLRLPPEQIFFGTNSPLFVPRAAVMKVLYAETNEEIKRRIAGGNTERFI